MKASIVVRSLSSFSLPSTDFPTSSRNQLSFPPRVFICRAKYDDRSSSVRVVPQNLLAAEKEEAKAVLNLFLKKQGLSNIVASRTINKADLFVDHLISRLHSVHKSRYLVGSISTDYCLPQNIFYNLIFHLNTCPELIRFLLTIAGRELTTLEIRDALIPYLENLLEKHGDILVNLVENFPSPPGKERTEEIQQKTHVIEQSAAPISPPSIVLDTKQRRALARVSDIVLATKFPPHILYLMDLGMDIELIRQIIKKFPSFAYYSLEGKIKPFVEFLLDLGVPKSDIPIILGKRPQLCGISLTENLIPTMGFLEDLGVDKKQWAKVISRFPAVLTYSRPKLEATVDFLHEMGLSSGNVGKILTRCPQIISYSVEDKLRPTAEYLGSLGVDVAVVLYRCPQTFGLSIDAHLKPFREFFLERGYSVGDFATMATRYPALLTFSLAENMVQKWEFFLTMEYPRSELIKFPQYFGYSLEERIKPRYEFVKESGVRLILNQVLSLSDENFEKLVKKKLRKMANG